MHCFFSRYFPANDSKLLGVRAARACPLQDEVVRLGASSLLEVAHGDAQAGIHAIHAFMSCARQVSTFLFLPQLMVLLLLHFIGEHRLVKRPHGAVNI